MKSNFNIGARWPMFPCSISGLNVTGGSFFSLGVDPAKKKRGGGVNRVVNDSACAIEL